MRWNHAVRRKLIQIAAFGFSNLQPTNLGRAKLYTGKWKSFCNPGLHCYSCPAATLSCPIGALQAVNGSMRFSFSFYVVGFLLAMGVLFGRLICGYVCPFGLLQELIAKLPVRKRRLPAFAKYIKYGILGWFVLLWPWIIKGQNLFGMGDPTFCEFICPSGFLFAGVPLLMGDAKLRSVIGPIFSIKLLICITVLAGCVFVFRFFCKVICPLGAIYGLLNRISFYRLEVDKERCVSCGACKRSCRMDVDPVKTPDSPECIRCGDCAHACPTEAICLGYRAEKKRNDAKNKR